MGDVVPETPLAISSSQPKETDEVYDFGGCPFRGAAQTHLRPTQCLCGTI
ncbi:Hypothetical protein FKW44_013877 [Caligus rogercresseyi]|uniref:Uncharacterized protein n=1 Tax=Caligus rogercresseyi TaxID=217165 RepID=A0A7T8GY74_CALRO|nr:Hypothetical protein FKW44_013877 [Caligus rogercresseyi]